jgi:hypothetical protein
MDKSLDGEELRRSLEEADLLDAQDPGGEDRLRAYKLLLGRGATISDLREHKSDLGILAAQLAICGLSTLSRRRLAERVGVSLELVERLLLAAGFPVIDPDVAVANENDVLLFETFAAGAGLYGEDVALQLARVIGAATSRIADAFISAFIGTSPPVPKRAYPPGSNSSRRSKAIPDCLLSGLDLHTARY